MSKNELLYFLPGYAPQPSYPAPPQPESAPTDPYQQHHLGGGPAVLKPHHLIYQSISTPGSPRAAPRRPPPTASNTPAVARRSGNNEASAAGKSEFAKVSDDMNELVYHLNSIQNDISELAGRPISIYDNSEEK